jgi:hypothetical protein
MNVRLEDIKLRRDNVIVRRILAEDVDLGTTKQYGANQNVHAEGESVKGVSLLMSSPDIEKCRGEVVSVGPDCRNVRCGDFVILRDTVGRSATKLDLADGKPYIITQERDSDGDILCKVDFVNIPISVLTEAKQ